VYAAPTRRDEKIGGAVVVNVAHGYLVKAKGIAGGAAGESFHQVSVFAGVQVSASAADRCTAVLPCAYDQIRMSVSVHVPGDLGAGTESFAGSLAGQGQQKLAIFS